MRSPPRFSLNIRDSDATVTIFLVDSDDKNLAFVLLDLCLLVTHIYFLLLS